MIDTSSLTESEATVLSGYDAFGRGDMGALERLFLPGCTWTHRNAGRLGGTKQGFPAILAFLTDSMRRAAGRCGSSHARRWGATAPSRCSST